MSYRPPPPPLPRRPNENPVYQSSYAHVPSSAPYQQVPAEQQSVAQPQNLPPPPLPPRPVQSEQQGWQPPLPDHPRLGKTSPAYSTHYARSPFPPQNEYPDSRRTSTIEDITTGLRNLSTGRSAQHDQQWQNNAMHYYPNPTPWSSPYSATSTLNDMSVSSHAGTSLQQLQQYQNESKSPVYYPPPPPPPPSLPLQESPQVSLSATQASPASSTPHNLVPNSSQSPINHRTPRTTASLINFFAGQSKEEPTPQHELPQHAAAGLPLSPIPHNLNIPPVGSEQPDYESAGKFIDKSNLQPSVEDAKDSDSVAKATNHPGDPSSDEPRAIATPYPQTMQLMHVDGSSADKSSLHATTASPGCGYEVNSGLIPTGTDSTERVRLEKSSPDHAPVDKKFPIEVSSRRGTFSAAVDNTAQPTLPCRFRRPVKPPTNIPQFQANEYIYFETCCSPHRFSVIWFRSLVAPKFLVCATCFERHIRYTPLSTSFTGKLETLGDDGRCMWNVTRMVDVLWPANRPSDDPNVIHAYMKERSNIPSCRGVSGLTGSEVRAVGMTWYTPAHNALPHFVACRACIEEHVVGMGFEHMFIPHTKQQGDAEQWACDIALPYIQRLLKTTARLGDWSAFITGAQHRLSLPQCPSFKPVKANSRTWHRPRAWPESSVCESCFLDQVALTSLDGEFAPAPVPIQARLNDWTCDLWSIPAQGAVGEAIARNDIAIFRKFFHVLATNPPCSPAGIVGGNWYTLKGGCPNFDVCATCYTGLIATFHLENEFQPRYDVSKNQLLGCDFCPGIGRSIQYLNKFDEAFHSPHFDVFTSYVRRVANVAPCQGIEPVKNAAWWRLEDTINFHVCSECYENIIRDTPSSNMFNDVGTIPTEVVCCMYSTNMRKRYNDLCTTNSLAARENFIAYANHRQAIYSQTVPVMRNIIAMAKFNLAQQRMNNAASSFYNTMDMTAGVQIRYGPSAAYKTVYGSSATGSWYNTPYGIESERLSAKAMGIMNGIGNDTMKVGMLEKIWKEVE